ncbi:uncharacterized protein [Dysidea avara]|uniref:uncharacterized protein isoform X2 n=1 Tax=Dysidea avara TaxID=196820 RepID=UPI003332CA58
MMESATNKVVAIIKKSRTLLLFVLINMAFPWKIPWKKKSMPMKCNICDKSHTKLKYLPCNHCYCEGYLQRITIPTIWCPGCGKMAAVPIRVVKKFNLWDNVIKQETPTDDEIKEEHPTRQCGCGKAATSCCPDHCGTLCCGTLWSTCIVNHNYMIPVPPCCFQDVFLVAPMFTTCEMCCGCYLYKSCWDPPCRVRCPMYHSILLDAVPNEKADKEIEDLRVISPNMERGCKWQGGVTEVYSHQSSCGYQEVQCPRGCGRSALKQHLADHLQNEFTRSKRPTESQLLDHVVTDIAAQWKDLGTKLLSKSTELDNIERNHPQDVRICCREMLRSWLKQDNEASWAKLIAALRAPGLTQNVLANKLEMQFVKSAM